MTKTNVDFHVHVTDHYDLAFAKSLPFIGGKRYFGLFNNPDNIPEQLLNRCFNSQPNTLTGIINFDDNRARAILDDVAKYAKKRAYSTRVEEDYLSISRGNQSAAFIAGREIRTAEGDILLIGSGTDICSRNLESVVKMAREKNYLVLAPHTGRQFGISLSAPKIEKLREFFDGVDSIEIAKKLNIPFYASSDSHTINLVHSTSTVFTNLDLSSRIKLIESLRLNLQQQLANPSYSGKSQSAGEIARHLIGCCVIAPIGLKTGLIKRIDI